MNKITYKDWVNFSEDERQKIKNSWNPYEGDGSGIVQFAREEFKKRYKNIPGVLDIDSGLYHGGIYIISVTIKKVQR